MAKTNKIDQLASMLAVMMLNKTNDVDFYAVASKAYEIANHTAMDKKKEDVEQEEKKLHNKIQTFCCFEKSIPEIKRAVCSKQYNSRAVTEAVYKMHEENILQQSMHISGFGRQTIKYVVR